MRSWFGIVRSGVLSIAVGVLAVATGAQEAELPTIAPRCEAAVDRAAGRYAKCLLKAAARAARAARSDEDALEEANEEQTECRERFGGDAERAVSRYGEDQCTPLIAEIENRAAAYAKAMALESSGQPALELLLVMTARGGKLTESTLTLSGVSPKMGVFSDRRYRFSGQIPTQEFVDLFDAAFGDDPLSADIACGGVGQEENKVLRLSNPELAGASLTFTASPVVGGSSDPTTASPFVCSSPLHLSYRVCTTSSPTCHPLTRALAMPLIRACPACWAQLNTALLPE